MRIEGVVAELLILNQVPKDVDTESIDAFGKPRAHDIMHGPDHIGITPIQIWLLGKESMIVILFCGVVELPRASPKLR